VTADASAKKRFVLVEQELHAIPSDPLGLFGFKPMTLGEKLRVFAEPFIPKGKESDEAVYDFAKRRFGVKAARYFMDPLVSGIYAGDSEFLSMEAAFPRIYGFEQTHGSVIRGMLASGGKRMKADLTSFRKGMGQLVETLTARLQDHIHLNESVLEIVRAQQYYMVVTDRDKYAADELFICTPAYAAAEFLENIHTDLGRALKSIDYAPLAVAGLLFKKSAFKKIPEGFGYLVPLTEESAVLGTLVDSNVFEGRSPASHVLLRVMLGGSRNPECSRQSRDELLALAYKEIDQRYGVTASAQASFMVSYLKAIPQYETSYLTLKRRIEHGVEALPRLHLLANYLNGVAVNDCIRNAQKMAERIKI